MVNIDNIHVIDRIIYPSQTRIDTMAKSLSGPMGQINAVLITKHLHSAWKVVAGATRVLAGEQLKWKQIEATIIGADNDFEYQLIEVAENLHRHDLSETERVKLKKVEGELFAKRRAFFNKLLEENPELPKAKAKGGRGHKGGVRNAARQAGVAETTAREHVNKLRGEVKSRSLPTTAAETKTLYCSFCGKSQHDVRQLIAGPTVFICDECIKQCADIIRQKEDAAPKTEQKSL